MSAIECKIIICGNDVSNAAKTAIDVVDDLAQDQCLMEEFVEASEEYVSKMYRILGGLTE
jgi:hypothetical protein